LVSSSIMIMVATSSAFCGKIPLFHFFSAVPLFFRFFTKKKLSFFIEKFCILKTR